MTISANTPARVVVLLITIAVVLVLLLATGMAASVGGEQPGSSGEPIIHRVVAGDTLWDIAADYTPRSDDVRRTIHEIRQLNDLDGSLIVPGQVLLIPGSD